MLEVGIFINYSNFVVMCFYIIGAEGTTFIKFLGVTLIVITACAQIPLIKAVSLI